MCPGVSIPIETIIIDSSFCALLGMEAISAVIGHEMRPSTLPRESNYGPIALATSALGGSKLC
jgi:hypothetical protein